MADIPPGHEELEKILAEDRFLRSLAWSLLGEGHEADDAVQHTWLRSLLHPPRRPVALRSFLSRILRNRVHNQRRDASRRARHEQAAARDEALPSTDEMVAQEELRRRVSDAVLALGEPYRTTIWLRYREELPPREIAARMAVPVETVRTRLGRALFLMRNRLDADYGDRRIWAPLVTVLRPLLPTSALSLGALTVNKNLILAAVAVLALLLISSALLQPGPTGPSASSSGPKIIAQSSPPGPGALNRSVLEPVIGSGGTLLHADGSPAGSLPYWIWTDRRPRWTTIPVVIPEVGEFVRGMQEPDGSTDGEGRFPWPGDGDVTAISFAASEEIRVTYELPLVAPEVYLPELGEVKIQMQGARDTDPWTVSLTPIYRENPNHERHRILEIETASGPAILSVARGTIEMVGEAELGVPIVPAIEYRESASSPVFAIEPHGFELRDGDVARHYFDGLIRAKPTLEVRIVDDGGSPVSVGGQLWDWKGAEPPELAWGNTYEIVAGSAEVYNRRFASGETYGVTAVLEDGEELTGTFRFQPGEMSRTLYLTRQGAPTFRVAFDPPVDLETVRSVVFEDREGELQVTRSPSPRPLAADRPRYSAMDWMGAPNGDLVFVGPPPDWHQAWVILKTGRVANIQRASRRHGTTVWLPDSELQPVNLQEHVNDRGNHQIYVFSFLVELVSSTGERKFVTADSFQYEWYYFEEWDEAPVWKKRAPLGTGYHFVFRPLERGALPGKTFTVPRR